MFIIFGWPERKIGEQSLTVHCNGCQRDTVHKVFAQQSRQLYLERLHGGLTRRLVFGTILTGIGGLMILLMTVGFFAVPPGSAEHEQKMDAVALGLLLGLFPLVSGFATLLTAKPARRFLIAERNALLSRKSPE
jgi:hypothetical protein